MMARRNQSTLRLTTFESSESDMKHRDGRDQFRDTFPPLLSRRMGLRSYHHHLPIHSHIRQQIQLDVCYFCSLQKRQSKKPPTFNQRRSVSSSPSAQRSVVARPRQRLSPLAASLSPTRSLTKPAPGVAYRFGLSRYMPFPLKLTSQ